MLALDGTAQGSLQYRVCIEECLHPSKLAELTGETFRPEQLAVLTRLDSNFLIVSYNPERESLLADLATYSYANWDGEGAIGISSSVIEWTRGVLQNLISAAPNPDITPAASGSVCMEWANGDDFLWADVEPSGKLLTLEKISGKRTESSFDIGDSRIKNHLASVLTRLFA